MYGSIAIFAAGFLIAASIASGGAGATQLKFGEYVGESKQPTFDGYTGT